MIENNEIIDERNIRCIAFEGHRRIASGLLEHVALKAKKIIDRGETAPVLVFNEETSQIVEIDFRGKSEQVIERLSKTKNDDRPAADSESARRGPGRPKLGVVAREVTLLPRHWDWLDEQPGGASAVLRQLVEAAKRANQGRDQARRRQEAVYKFMSVMAGNFPGYEEALRVFYANNDTALDKIVVTWPKDIRDHVKKLVEKARDAAEDCSERKQTCT